MQPISFANSYAALPDRFHARLAPTPVPNPVLVRSNSGLARLLGIDPAWLQSDEALQALAGNSVLPGSEPIATAYAGHQFGGFNPQLGDGRAILLGEVIGSDGNRYDIQLKGSGRTPFSRGGDGRSPLGPVLREYIISEAMAAFGVPTTRSLAAIASGERVVRDEFLPGGVLTRIASSHIRIGTFQFFAARKDDEAVKLLADHVIARHYPQVLAAENVYLALLENAIARQAQLIAHWQSIGFIHGVMNTDNMLLCGETIDYGPCAFMDAFHPQTVYSSIDHQGRYAYHNQPGIAQWNLSWLASALLPLIAPEQEAAVELARTALSGFVAQFESAYHTRMLNKLGLSEVNEDNLALLNDLLQLMDENSADFTLTFRRLAERAERAATTQASVVDIFELPENFIPWLRQWQTRLASQSTSAREQQTMMFANNPVFIPRNHLVEEVIVAAQERNDFEPFQRLVDVLEKPFDFDPDKTRYATPPLPEQVVSRTFCGT